MDARAVCASLSSARGASAAADGRGRRRQRAMRGVHAFSGTIWGKAISAYQFG
jgi:hypothetical protein